MGRKGESYEKGRRKKERGWIVANMTFKLVDLPPQWFFTLGTPMLTCGSPSNLDQVDQI